LEKGSYEKGKKNRVREKKGNIYPNRWIKKYGSKVERDRNPLSQVGGMRQTKVKRLGGVAGIPDRVKNLRFLLKKGGSKSQRKLGVESQ